MYIGEGLSAQFSAPRRSSRPFGQSEGEPDAHTYIYHYIYAFSHIYISIYMHTSIYMSTDACIHTYLCISMIIYECICEIYLFIYMYVFILV